MAYLFVHFIGEEKDGEQIYFSVSKDGMHWMDLGDGPALVSEVGEKGVRDPFLVRNCIDHKFYILATDLRIACNKGWEAAQYKGSISLITWESEDLIHWNGAQKLEIPGMIELKAGCVWAPEAIYDREKDSYMVFWASMVEKKQRIFAAWTKDFHHYVNVHPYIERSQQVIDTTMAEENGVFYRFSACEEYKGILMEKGKLPDAGDFETCREGALEGTLNTEGPIIVYLKEEKKWCLYVDDIGHGAGYVPLLAESLKEGRFIRAAEGSYNFGKRRKRHGSILPITEEEYERMISNYHAMKEKGENLCTI
jgi:hypothetical protein